MYLQQGDFMKYKNITKEVLEFRTHKANGVKTSFALKPNESVDLYRTNLQIEGLEKVEKIENKIKNKKGDK